MSICIYIYIYCVIIWYGMAWYVMLWSVWAENDLQCSLSEVHRQGHMTTGHSVETLEFLMKDNQFLINTYSRCCFARSENDLLLALQVRVVLHLSDDVRQRPGQA